MARKDRERAEQEPASPSPESRSMRITPIDIQQKEFRLAFRGYNEREVDEFLDQLTEEVARLHADNRRLQEQVEFHRTEPLGAAPPVGAGAGQGYERDDDEQVLGARAEADRIMAEARADGEHHVERARAHAAQVVAEAEARAAALSGGQGGPPDAPGRDPSASRFLAREREFLQSLAGLIQRHAEAVKEDARQARRAVPPPGVSPEASPVGSSQAVPAGTDTGAEPGPDAGAGSSPVAEVEQDPVADAEPGAIAGPESGPVATDPDPVAADPDPVVATDPDPVVATEPGRAWGMGGPAVDAEAPPPPESWPPAPGSAGASADVHGSRFAMPGGEEASPDAASQTRVMGGIVTATGEDRREVRPSPSADEGDPEPSPAYAASEPEQDAGEDRSLRELFWGED
jgi:cell division initiation protein